MIALYGTLLDMNKLNRFTVGIVFFILVMMFSVSCAGTISTPTVISGTDFEELENDVSEVAALITDYNQLRQFFNAIGYGDEEPSHDFHFMYKGKEWSVNKSAIATFFDNTGDCGAGSNLFCFLLNGDYDEIGYLYRRDETGGHVINYFHDNNGLWHIVDVTGFVGRDDYANHITGNSLQSVADEYVRRVNHGWQTHGNTDMYIRSFYAIKCKNGESHSPVYSLPVREGMLPGYYTADVQEKVIELYVKDGDKRNSIQFVNYEIPTSVYPSGIGYSDYKTDKSMEELRAFASLAKEIASSAYEATSTTTKSSDVITLRMYNDDIVYPNGGFGFGAARKELKVQLNGEIITDYEFIVKDNIGSVTKTDKGTLIFEASKVGVAEVTIIVGDTSATFRWKN